MWIFARVDFCARKARGRFFWARGDFCEVWTPQFCAAVRCGHHCFVVLLGWPAPTVLLLGWKLYYIMHLFVLVIVESF